MTDLQNRLKNIGFTGGAVAENGLKEISLTEPVLNNRYSLNGVF